MNDGRHGGSHREFPQTFQQCAGEQGFGVRQLDRLTQDARLLGRDKSFRKQPAQIDGCWQKLLGQVRKFRGDRDVPQARISHLQDGLRNGRRLFYTSPVIGAVSYGEHARGEG